MCECSGPSCPTCDGPMRPSLTMTGYYWFCNRWSHKWTVDEIRLRTGWGMLEDTKTGALIPQRKP